jgi:hypothetical protein
MSPYRSAPSDLWPARARDGFAFPWARVRLGRARFELSFWDPFPLLTVWIGAMCGIPFFGPTWLATVLILTALTLSFRRAFVVTRETSWLALTVLGIRWKKALLGRRPLLENNGWNWSEIAVVPSERALRAGLHDEERAVLVEWSDGSERKNAESAELIALARAQIDRLHA